MLSRINTQNPVMKSQSTDNTPHKLVLLIDDSSIDNFVNQKMIELNAFSEEVIAFTRATKALNYLTELDKSNKADSKIPSIIFLDLNMPIMNGIEFIKQYENLSEKIKNNCRIIILTSSINPADIDTTNNNECVLTNLNKPLMKNNFDLIDLLIYESEYKTGKVKTKVSA